jgi:hypothetical protein
MNLGKYIEQLLEKQGRTKQWTANQLNMNYKTFFYRLKNDSLHAHDLLVIAKLLGIDLNELKEQYNSDSRK